MFSFKNITNSQSETQKFKLGSNQQLFFPRMRKKTLRIKSESDFPERYAGISVYSQRHNMIIVSPGDKTVHFYSASTLLPVEGRDKLELKSPARCISFCPQTDVYLFGCIKGEVYAYDASSKNLQKLQDSDFLVLSIAFISPVSYVFSVNSSREIHLGSLENQDDLRFSPQKTDSYSLYNLKNQKILLSSTSNGDVIVYRTDEFPTLSNICRVKVHKPANFAAEVESARIKEKDYIITYGLDDVIRIWHLRKGKMIKIKTIKVERRIHGLAYLEEYKMITVLNGMFSDIVTVLSLVSGKLECMLDFKMKEAKHVFVMKNAIGVTDSQRRVIKFAQLGIC